MINSTDVGPSNTNLELRRLLLSSMSFYNHSSMTRLEKCVDTKPQFILDNIWKNTLLLLAAMLTLNLPCILRDYIKP
jgi:hypothetical protein